MVVRPHVPSDESLHEVSVEPNEIVEIFGMGEDWVLVRVTGGSFGLVPRECLRRVEYEGRSPAPFNGAHQGKVREKGRGGV